jgi:hypothetical protein
MTDAWDWWRQAKADPKQIGKAPHLQVSADNPEQGYYRMRFGAQKPWLPVAIWKDGDGNWVALRSGRSVDAAETWNSCCRHPVSAEAYEQAMADGGWADDEPTVKAMIGDNIGYGDDLESLAEQIESAKQGAEIYRDITSDEEAGKAQSLRARMNELAGTVDKKREALKRPHLEAGKAIDLRWMPLVKEAKNVADMLRQFIATFETAKLRERRRLEEERQREERRREAERKAGEEASAPEPLPPLPPPDTTIKGGYGRAASIGTEMVVTAIKDQDALYQYFRNDADLKACLLALAQKAVRAGHNPPGVEIEERAKIS